MLIIASIGMTTAKENDIRKIILAGADIIRHNFSYYSPAKNIEYIKKTQIIIDDLHADTKQLIDFPLIKTRLGDFKNKILPVKEGEKFILKSAKYSDDCREYIPIQIKNIGEKVDKNQIITIGDGEIAIQVTDIIDKQSIKIKILNNGTIKYIKTINIEKPLNKNWVIERYKEIINLLKDTQYDYIAVSYIQKTINNDIKKILPKDKKIIIKIENQNGLNDIEEIINDDFYSMVLIDRGELGVNTPYERIGIYQKEITNYAKKNKKPVIISTQILESAIDNYIPGRSDILNLTNMILDGISGIMFGQETVLGLRPSYPIYTAKKIINATLEYKKTIEQYGK